MVEFLDLFAEVILYPLTIEINNLEDNPLTVIAVAALFGLFCVKFLRRWFLSCRM